jgi:hypothetical protein
MIKPYTVMEHRGAERPIVIMELPEDLHADRAYLTFTTDEAWELVVDLCVAIDTQRKERNEQNRNRGHL